MKFSTLFYEKKVKTSLVEFCFMQLSKKRFLNGTLLMALTSAPSPVDSKLECISFPRGTLWLKGWFTIHIWRNLILAICTEHILSLKYYPQFSFNNFFSYLRHFLSIFVGLRVNRSSQCDRLHLPWFPHRAEGCAATESFNHSVRPK